MNEKIVAVFDAGMRLVCGATTSHVIMVREQVAANAPPFQPNASLRLVKSELSTGSP